MNAQERDLINSVFDRLQRIAGGPKDAEAEALILQRMRAVPDSAYNLVEAVVVQEQALTEAQARIQDLERQLAQPRVAPPAAGFGASNPWGRGSVPQTAPQPQYAPQPQSQYGQPQQPYGQPPYGQPQYAQPQAGPWGQQGAGGSFLRTAAGAAVGVAGGMLLAQGVSQMFGGGLGGHGAGTAASPVSETNTTTNNYYGDPGGAAQPQQVSYDTTIADESGFGGDFGGDGSDTF